MSNDLYAIRDYKPEDFAFVKSCFLRGVYYGDSWFSFIPKAVFMTNYSRVADALISSPNKTIKVACLKDDIDVILGYSILAKNYSSIDFVFVKSAWRKQGIGRALIPKHPLSVSHLTALGKTLLPKLQGCIFDPFNL